MVCIVAAFMNLVQHRAADVSDHSQSLAGLEAHPCCCVGTLQSLHRACTPTYLDGLHVVAPSCHGASVT